MLPNQAQCNLDKTIMFLSGFSLEIIHTKYLWIFMDETFNTTEHFFMENTQSFPISREKRCNNSL